MLREYDRLRPGRYSAGTFADRREAPATLLARTTAAGSHVRELCATIHHRKGQRAVRAILGVLALVRRHGPVAVDRACAEAIGRRVPSYRFVRDRVRALAAHHG